MKKYNKENPKIKKCKACGASTVQPDGLCEICISVCKQLVKGTVKPLKVRLRYETTDSS